MGGDLHGFQTRYQGNELNQVSKWGNHARTHNWKAMTSPWFAETLLFHYQPCIAWGERIRASPVGGEGQRSILCDHNGDGVGPDASGETQESRNDGNKTHVSNWRRGRQVLGVEPAEWSDRVEEGFFG